MNKRKGSMVLLSSLLAVSLSLVISSPLAMVWASSNGDDFLEIKKAEIGIKEDIIKTIFFKTRGEIPTDGSGGAFGYGVVTADNKSIVTTTHATVLDSELQANIYDPVWHNHFAQLKTVDPTICPSTLAVDDLSFESPGIVKVKDSFASLKNLPASAEGQFSEQPITPGSDVKVVASFKLVPLLDLTELQPSESGQPLVAVCIADIQGVDPRYVDIFEIKNHYGYGSEEYYPSYYEDRHNYRGEYHEKDYRNNYDYDNEHRR